MKQRDKHFWLVELPLRYGIVLAFILLCVFFSVATWQKQQPEGRIGARAVYKDLKAATDGSAKIAIVVKASNSADDFIAGLEDLLSKDYEVVKTIRAEQPSEGNAYFKDLVAKTEPSVDVILCNYASAQWGAVEDFEEKFPELSGTKVIVPEKFYWPTFLLMDNLLNIADQIAVIAIIAVGMTMVIITGGIDLSVGSLIAFTSVITTLMIRGNGAEEATTLVMILACVGGVLVTAGVGTFNGLMVTMFRVPPFIVTLAVMLIASGWSFTFAKGQSVFQVPETFNWLGHQSIVLMFVIYVVAHLLMTETTLGRYIYAVGGNPEAARLSGVPVRAVLLFVYTTSGLLAGVGGVVMASQLVGGSPTYGVMYELYVIAAVVVGGTSLAGGEGNMFGTLLGAFTMGVIQNGMNLFEIEPYSQKIVLGSVILAAVLLDQLKHQSWARSK